MLAAFFVALLLIAYAKCCYGNGLKVKGTSSKLVLQNVVSQKSLLEAIFISPLYQHNRAIQ